MARHHGRRSTSPNAEAFDLAECPTRPLAAQVSNVVAVSGTIQSVERAAAILRALAVEVEPVPLASVALAVDLPKPTAHGLLATLVEVGFVDRDPASGGYL